jgi:hypothetical protein
MTYLAHHFDGKYFHPIFSILYVIRCTLCFHDILTSAILNRCQYVYDDLVFIIYSMGTVNFDILSINLVKVKLI